MLKLLHIENIAVIEKCDIEFEDGFNVLTGETGAGKSIVIDAIGAVLGSRTSKEVVRSGAERALVSALFEDCSEEAASWLSENGYDSEDDSVLIQREISADGKSSARINGKPITAAMLKSFGILLVNILGQHDSQRLLNPEEHPVFIDRVAAGEAFDGLLSEYKEVYAKLCDKISERKKLDMNEQEKARRIEMLRFQTEELSAADLQENEEDELKERKSIIQSSEKINRSLTEAYGAFFGDDDSSGICGLLSNAQRALSSVSGISEGFAKLSETISDMYYSAEDISEELRSMRDGFDFSEENINEIESRLDTIQKLKRKYGGSVSEMLEFLEKAQAELESIELSEERIISLDNEIKRLNREANALADKLYELRCKAARYFEEKIVRELSELDMPNVRFAADVVRCETLGETGGDSVEFMLSPNLGEDLKPLSKIASGGELSRIMLALKNVLSEADFVHTLIFDEIDTGVSGRAAQRIAEKLYSLSCSKQVLCVTHLGQISAMADIHFRIEKKEKAGRTFTSVTPLDDAERAMELARITGGSTISDITIKNAEEMLRLAEETKNACKR